MLSQTAIEEFQEIYFKSYGEKLSLSEATTQAYRLLNLYKAVLGHPLNNQSNDKCKEKEVVQKDTAEHIRNSQDKQNLRNDLLYSNGDNANSENIDDSIKSEALGTRSNLH